MSLRFQKIDTPIAGLYRIDRKPIRDSRGFFSRFYCQQEFEELGLDFEVAQMNHTITEKKGAARGLHFQYPPKCEIKLVSCVVGEIWDVVVDLRVGSPTYMHWHAERLSGDNQASLFIPKGFAHGFQTLTEHCQLLYLHSEFYAPTAEGALNPYEPKLGIEWPLPITDLSERDKHHPMLDDQFSGIKIS